MVTIKELEAGKYLAINSEFPSWITTNEKGNLVLKSFAESKSSLRATLDYSKAFKVDEEKAFTEVKDFYKNCKINKLFERGEAYKGRDKYLRLEKLSEFWIHINQNCNLRCKHCLVSSGPKLSNGLETEILENVMQEAHSLGTKRFYITGGEPFLRKDIFHLLDLIIKELGCEVIILTNGTLITEEVARKLSSYPKQQLTLQISLDGATPEINDSIREKGSYKKIVTGIKNLVKEDIRPTITTTITSENYRKVPQITEFTGELGCPIHHLMWLHKRGREKGDMFLPVEKLIKTVDRVMDTAQKVGVAVDNYDSIKLRVFGKPGIKVDGANSGWSSLALYIDGFIYPSASFVGIKELKCGDIFNEGLEEIWKGSPVLKKIRKISTKELERDPYKFLSGGGDLEHSYFYSKKFIGGDPYYPVYVHLLKKAIKEATPNVEDKKPEVLSSMSDFSYLCIKENEGDVVTAHTNCVLSFDLFDEGHKKVSDYYGKAANDVEEDIVNPVKYEREYIEHIPEEVVKISYGCGSPVISADVKEGETVLDLGSGAGLECFIASRLTGKSGEIIGIDMTDEMLKKANKAKKEVIKSLGYDNVEFKRGYLEFLPIEDKSIDLVISNCVVNLSPDKKRVFEEIMRVLKPGGRVIISDVAAEKEFPLSIKLNNKLWGECISGALTENELYYHLEKTGFGKIEALRRFLYRVVDGYKFYSLTFRAYRPEKTEEKGVLYKGHFKEVRLDDGTLLKRGEPARVKLHFDYDEIFMLDETGTTLGVDFQDACALPPNFTKSSERKTEDCMLCGAPLRYLPSPIKAKCCYCGREFTTNVICQNGHYVCDECHAQPTEEIIKKTCLNTGEIDPVKIVNEIMNHPTFPMHGPDHHGMVPGAFVAAYINSGGNLPKGKIVEAIERGASIPGGYCAFFGACAAALGIGIAYSVILSASPLTPGPRQIVQSVVATTLSKIAGFKAARCCKRETWTSIRIGVDLSEKYLPIPLKISTPIVCGHSYRNRECIRIKCPFYKAKSLKIKN